MKASYQNILSPACLPSIIDFGHSIELDERSYIKTSNTSKTVIIPFLGTRVFCSLFGISDDFIEKYQSLDARFIKNKASTFFFRASSNSMEPLIFENDILIVDRSIEFYQGRVIVAAYDGILICKRYFKKERQVILKSDNPSHKDLIISEEMDVRVWGVVIGIARELL